MEIVKGKLKRIRYHNDENSYTIAILETESEKEMVITGYFPKLANEIFYEFQGTYVNHPTYGRQFQVTSYEKKTSQSTSGLIAYLSSDFFSGIGEKTATKIVDLLGNNAVEKILDDKNVLKDVPLNPLRINRLYQELKTNQLTEKNLVALYGYGLSGRLSMNLISFYGDRTLEVLEKNPFQLIEDISGIGFLRADEIARKLNFSKDDPMRIKAGIFYTIEATLNHGDSFQTENQLIVESKKLLNLDFEVEKYLVELVETNKIILENEKYYVPYSYYCEVAIAKKIKKLLAKPILDFKEDYLDGIIKLIEKQKSITYTRAQTTAIINSIIQPLSIITGGPGTGKTTIIDGLLEVYRIINKLDYKDKYIGERIGLVAPTGRAAKRMNELLKLPTSTIHRLLGFDFSGQFTHDKENLLPHKMIVVDESSMIDMFLAKNLLDAIDDNCKVVFVGDVDQIPSVGAGRVLNDLIESKIVPTTKLLEIHRQAEQSRIVSLATKINNQNLRNSDLITENDLYMFKTSADQVKAVILNQVKGALEQGHSLIDDVQILIPIYKGGVGIDEVNLAIQAATNPNKLIRMTRHEKIYYIGDKVIQLVNDPKRLIMNGDIGVVTNILNDSNQKNFMTVKYDSNEVSYYQEDLDEINLAYAISIHKSQGSEYPIVILPMIKSYLFMLKKELIYTAVTRAKNMLIILGELDLLLHAVNNLSEARQTTLCEKLIADSSKKSDDQPNSLSPYDFM